MEGEANIQIMSSYQKKTTPAPSELEGRVLDTHGWSILLTVYTSHSCQLFPFSKGLIIFTSALPSSHGALTPLEQWCE